MCLNNHKECNLHVEPIEEVNEEVKSRLETLTQKCEKRIISLDGDLNKKKVEIQNLLTQLEKLRDEVFVKNKEKANCQNISSLTRTIMNSCEYAVDVLSVAPFLESELKQSAQEKRRISIFTKHQGATKGREVTCILCTNTI